MEKLFSGVKKRELAQKFYEKIVWGDVKSPTKFDKFIVTGKNDEVEVYERTLTAKLAKVSTYICWQARRWYEEEIVGDVAEWYKRWDQHPFTSRLAAIEEPYKDADYSLTYMNMAALRDNLKDGYKKMLGVANQCDRERIDYRGDLPTYPIRDFKAAAAEFYKVVNAVCIKANGELKNTVPDRGTVKKIIGWVFKKTSHLIIAIIFVIISGLILAIVVDIFNDFGWLERSKTFIYNILRIK